MNFEFWKSGQNYDQMKTKFYNQNIVEILNGKKVTATHFKHYFNVE